MMASYYADSLHWRKRLVLSTLLASVLESVCGVSMCVLRTIQSFIVNVLCC